MSESTPRPCTMAAALNVLGEKWALLVIRELAYGVHRFESITKNTGAPRDILSSRLRRLEAAGVVEKRQYHDRPVRFEYHLTDAGNELRPVLLTLAQWGKRWAAEPTVVFTHSCGEDLDIVHTCRACGEEVTGFDLGIRKVAGEWTSAA